LGGHGAEPDSGSESESGSRLCQPEAAGKSSGFERMWPWPGPARATGCQGIRTGLQVSNSESPRPAVTGMAAVTVAAVQWFMAASLSLAQSEPGLPVSHRRRASDAGAIRVPGTVTVT
jgi:hypothetical protein